MILSKTPVQYIPFSYFAVFSLIVKEFFYSQNIGTMLIFYVIKFTLTKRFEKYCTYIPNFIKIRD